MSEDDDESQECSEDHTSKPLHDRKTMMSQNKISPESQINH